MSQRDGQAPPPSATKRAPLPTMPEGVETQAETAERIAREARQLAKRNESTLSAVEIRLLGVEDLVGRLPSALPNGPKGTGLAQSFIDLGVKVDALTDRLGETIEAIEADRKERVKEVADMAKRREPWSRAWWIAVAAAIGATMGAAATGAYHWVTTLHH